jgi:hypothetical protein
MLIKHCGGFLNVPATHILISNKIKGIDTLRRFLFPEKPGNARLCAQNAGGRPKVKSALEAWKVL